MNVTKWLLTIALIVVVVVVGLISADKPTYTENSDRIYQNLR